MLSRQEQRTAAKRKQSEVSAELRDVNRSIRKRECRDKAQMRNIKRFCMVLYILTAGDARLLQCAWQHQTNKHPHLACRRWTALTVTELIAEQLESGNLLPGEHHFAQWRLIGLLW